MIEEQFVEHGILTGLLRMARNLDRKLGRFFPKNSDKPPNFREISTDFGGAREVLTAGPVPRPPVPGRPAREPTPATAGPICIGEPLVRRRTA
jgi:hypothetical protein